MQENNQKMTIEELADITKQGFFEMNERFGKQIAELAVSTKNQIADLATVTKNDMAELSVSTKNQIADLATVTKNDMAELAVSTKNEIAELAIMTKEGFDAVDKKFDDVNKQIDGLRTDISRLPSKDYIDDKLADLGGLAIVRQRAEDKKVNLMADFLRKKNILGEGEIKMLNEIQVFPRPEMAK